ncbi:YfjI family protein [Sulfurimonas sp.]|jgi:hypothetical protein|uniref:YfjI family protein n=1 Tax=Sulfurimonas sp. TaxID=2022749 RepID=UPI0025FED9E6|nr:YfjI family protein [Sulfurimonas sp.]MBT5934546.1 DUF3987 domain-containing protein [Sulfurimonas sp.]
MGLDLKITDIEEAKQKLTSSIEKTKVVGTTSDVSNRDCTVNQVRIPVNNIVSKSAYELLHFTPDMIPEPIRRWTLDNCNHAEGSLNYGATAALVVIASVIGYHVRVKPKVNADWKITPTLWGMAIGNPSDRKSPVVDQFIKPLKSLEKHATEAYEEKISQYKEEEKHQKFAQKAKDKALQKAYELGDDAAIQNAKNMKVPKICEEPIAERFLINDATTESIGILASKSKRTILQNRDELSGFLASLKKAGREGDRSFFLEAFTGDRSYTYDRVGRGNINIERLSLSLYGTIQPSEVAKHIVSKDGKSDDGLAQRMQLSVFSDGVFKPYMDEPIDREARDRAYEIIKTLAYADFEVWGATNDPFDEIPYFSFDATTQELFVKWYGELKNKEKNELNLNMQAHLGKYYSLLPSLALVFFLIDKAADETSANSIGASHFKMAKKWCNVLETHARKMYGLTVSEPTISLTEKIVKYVKEHPEKLPATFGKISGDIRDAKAEDVELALKDIAEINAKTVVRLLSNV